MSYYTKAGFSLPFRGEAREYFLALVEASRWLQAYEDETLQSPAVAVHVRTLLDNGWNDADAAHISGWMIEIMDGASGDAARIYCSTENDGGNDQLAQLIWLTMQKFNLPGSIGWESAEVGETFGGAAFFVTKDGIRSMTTTQWLESQKP